jgi:hypothetical protein
LCNLVNSRTFYSMWMNSGYWQNTVVWLIFGIYEVPTRTPEKHWHIDADNNLRKWINWM